MMARGRRMWLRSSAPSTPGTQSIGNTSKRVRHHSHIKSSRSFATPYGQRSRSEVELYEGVREFSHNTLLRTPFSPLPPADGTSRIGTGHIGRGRGKSEWDGNRRGEFEYFSKALGNIHLIRSIMNYVNSPSSPYWG